MRLLDPRFNYVPAAATDVGATWRRHGYDPRANAERRRRLIAGRVAANDHAEAPAVRALVGVKA